jgi:hypothetical protein
MIGNQSSKQQEGGMASLLLFTGYLKNFLSDRTEKDYIKGILQTVAFSNLPRTSTKISEPAAANSLFT